MKVEKFEDLIVWQKSKDLAVNLYSIFKFNKDYGFRDQIQRASVSVVNNIAEGFERKSHIELIHFFHIARGSCGEVRAMLYLAKDLGYITSDQLEHNKFLTQEISRIITTFTRNTNKR